MLTELTFSNNKVTFSLEDKETLTIALDSYIHSAKEYTEHELMIALIGDKADNYSTKIIGLSLEGKIKFNVSAPDGYGFYYLTDSGPYRLGVVCIKIEGYDLDTNWSINPSNGALEVIGRAY